MVVGIHVLVESLLDLLPAGKGFSVQYLTPQLVKKALDSAIQPIGCQVGLIQLQRVE